MLMSKNDHVSHKQNRLLGALSDADFSLLAPHLTHRSIAQGDVLQESGDTIKHVYFLQFGMVSLLTVMQSGSVVETATVGHEGAVGVMAGLGSRIAPHRSVMQIKGGASRIAAARFEAAVTASAPMKDIVVRYSDFLMMMVQQSAGCNALHALEARLCRWLLQTLDRSDDDRLPLTQELLSQMLGVRRTTLTLVARGLQTSGLIRYRRGLIDILDRRGLESKACECYAANRRHNAAVFFKPGHDLVAGRMSDKEAVP